MREDVALLEKAQVAYDDCKTSITRARREAMEKAESVKSPPLLSDEEDERAVVAQGIVGELQRPMSH